VHVLSAAPALVGASGGGCAAVLSSLQVLLLLHHRQCSVTVHQRIPPSSVCVSISGVEHAHQ
jgi:hypothetical protein